MTGTQKYVAVAAVAPAPAGAPTVYATEGTVHSRLDLN